MTFFTRDGLSNHWATRRLTESIGHIYQVHHETRHAVVPGSAISKASCVMIKLLTFFLYLL